MSSMKWVDMCGSGSEIQGSSDDQPTKNPQEPKEIVSPTDLKKTISSPEPSSKSIKHDKQSRISDNLLKLSNHKENKVWLYAPTEHFKNRQSQVNQILSDNKQFQHINSINKGWEVKLDTQLAKKYIQFGYSSKGLEFRFLFSNKNENREATGKRMEKKYSEKFSDNKNTQRYQRNQKPKQKYEKSGYQRDREEDRGEKKKVKYVAKENIQKKQEDEKPKLEQIKQETKKIEQKQQVSEKSESQKRVDPQVNQEKVKQELQSNQEQKKLENREKLKQKQKIDDYEDKEEMQSDNKVKEKEKDKKKKKFKGKGGNGNFHDPNNPFSGLA